MNLPTCRQVGHLLGMQQPLSTSAGGRQLPLAWFTPSGRPDPHRVPRRPQRAWPQPPDRLSSRLLSAHGQAARVVLRRLRWSGQIAPEDYRAADALLAKAGVPERLQISLLGEADTAL